MGDLRAHKDDDLVINNMTKLSLDTDSSRFRLHLKHFRVLDKKDTFSGYGSTFWWVEKVL